MRNIPTLTKNLLIINVLAYAAGLAVQRYVDLNDIMGLHFMLAPDFHVWQLVTYMFMHGGFQHLFFNMFSLFIFGRILEQVWGSKRFLFYYLSTGLGAGLIQEITWMLTATSGFALVDGNGIEAMRGAEAISYALSHGIDVGAYYNSMVTIGASGAVFGILLAFGMMFPNAPMYLMFIPIPIKAKYLVIGYGALELMFGVAGIQQGVAHFAHLGGMLVGFLILLYWKKKGVFGGRRY